LVTGTFKIRVYEDINKKYLMYTQLEKIQTAMRGPNKFKATNIYTDSRTNGDLTTYHFNLITVADAFDGDKIKIHFP